jgi:urocanate hydratase
MYGQMTAGSWIYIGTQGILQGRMKRSHLWLCTKELEFSQGEICANRWV